MESSVNSRNLVCDVRIKKMKTDMNIVACLPLIFVLCSGCATSMLSDKLQYEDNPSREFVKYRQLTVKKGELIMGRVVEERPSRKGQYVRIQFPSALTNGTDRILEVLVHASKNEVRPTLHEGHMLHPTLRPAVGYLAQSHFYMKDELDAQTPRFLRQLKAHDSPHMGIVVVQLGYDAIEVSYGRANTALTEIDWVHRSERPKSRLLRKRRDEKAIRALKAKHLLAVPFDIVTFPIQLLIGIYGHFAGWAEC